MWFPFNSLNTEIKPGRYTIGIGLFFKLDFVGIIGYQANICYISTLEITLECNWTDRYDLTIICLYSTEISIRLFYIKIFVKAVILE